MSKIDVSTTYVPKVFIGLNSYAGYSYRNYAYYLDYYVDFYYSMAEISFKCSCKD